MKADFFVYPDGRFTHVLSGEFQTLEEALRAIIIFNKYVVPCDHARILMGPVKGDYLVGEGNPRPEDAEPNPMLDCCLIAIESLPADVDPRITPDGVGNTLDEDGNRLDKDGNIIPCEGIAKVSDDDSADGELDNEGPDLTG